jgi:hypothetical protein
MAIPTDPLLSQQWHLGNTGGLFDLNVRGVWNPTSGPAYTGAGTRVVVIDDGFDYNRMARRFPASSAPTTMERERSALLSIRASSATERTALSPMDGCRISGTRSTTLP